MLELGPITMALEDEVKGELRQHGIVVWLDKDGHYTSYVDQLAERYASETFPFPVVPFRGSYLEMLVTTQAGVGKIEDYPKID